MKPGDEVTESGWDGRPHTAICMERSTRVTSDTNRHEAQSPISYDDQPKPESTLLSIKDASEIKMSANLVYNATFGNYSINQISGRDVEGWIPDIDT